MLLLNYDFHDIHYILAMLRAYPKLPYNRQVIQAVIRVLRAPQTDNTVDTNRIRKELREVDALDREGFRFAYVDNCYTYGEKIIDDPFGYTLLEKAFLKLSEYAVKEAYEKLEDLADALHNIPIILAEDSKHFKRSARIEFSRYNRKYKTNLLKEFTNKA